MDPLPVSRPASPSVVRQRESSMAEQAQQLYQLLGRGAMAPPKLEEASAQPSPSAPASASHLQAGGPLGCFKCRWMPSGCSQCRSAPAGTAPDGSAVRLSRACDVRPYAGLPPLGLSDEQVEEVLKEVQRSKRTGRASDKEVHGWRVIYTLRRHGTTANRGDICIIDPRDGQKIFSLVGLERKMGRVQAMAWAPPPVHAPTAPPGARTPSSWAGGIAPATAPPM